VKAVGNASEVLASLNTLLGGWLGIVINFGKVITASAFRAAISLIVLQSAL
jgi:hypothetical protein